THQIVASFSGALTDLAPSIAKLDQRVNAATTKAVASGNVYTYCNRGGIKVPGLGLSTGAAGPYHSNIFVTNLPETVRAPTVSLEGFSTNDQADLLSLLVGPGGNNLDFFSLTGSNPTNPVSPFNVTFDDTAANIINQNLATSGSFKPTSFNTNIPYPQCPQ